MAIEIDELLIEGKREEYRNYIKEHINNVKTVWNNIITDRELREYVNKGPEHNVMNYGTYNSINQEIISINIDNHDKSKFSEEEFEPYRKNFYPVNEEEKEKNLLDYGLAWQHHKDYNKHHWDHWSERCIINEMPFIYVVEMFCDCAAMSIKFGGNAVDWLNDQLDKKEVKMGNKQKQWYIDLGEMYYSKYK